jgi:hypothetical protein
MPPLAAQGAAAAASGGDGALPSLQRRLTGERKDFTEVGPPPMLD